MPNNQGWKAQTADEKLGLPCRRRIFFYRRATILQVGEALVVVCKLLYAFDLRMIKMIKKKVLATKNFDLELIFYPEIDYFEKIKIVTGP